MTAAGGAAASPAQLLMATVIGGIGLALTVAVVWRAWGWRALASPAALPACDE